MPKLKAMGFYPNIKKPDRSHFEIRAEIDGIDAKDSRTIFSDNGWLTFLVSLKTKLGLPCDRPFSRSLDLETGDTSIPGIIRYDVRDEFHESVGAEEVFVDDHTNSFIKAEVYYWAEVVKTIPDRRQYVETEVRKSF